MLGGSELAAKQGRLLNEGKLCAAAVKLATPLPRIGVADV